MLTVNGLVKAYAGPGGRESVVAVDDLSFFVAEGTFCTLLGPSGCGKTTTLQCIAGLEQPSDGDILLDGKPVFSKRSGAAVAASDRNIGMIFQSYAIWPHMTVVENVMFPLLHGKRRTGAAAARKQACESLEMVQLGHLADRPSPHLSGGQQQRVALARAIVHRPPVLLLDEPLSNLDAKLRDAMRLELRQLVKTLGMTALLVTHDQAEAMSMSDQVVLMRGGRIVQQGSPREIFLRPTTDFAADFMGRSNLLRGTVSRSDELEVSVRTTLGELRCVAMRAHAVGDEVKVAMRPSAFATKDGAAPCPGYNRVSGTVRQLTFHGEQVEVELAAGEELVRVVLGPYVSVAVGEALVLQVETRQCVAVSILPAQPGAAPAPHRQGEHSR